MEIKIESVTNNEDEVAMLQLREQVFEREMGIVLDRLAALDDSGSFHLLALAGSVGDAVATLSVVDTSRHHELHNGYGLEFPPAARVARYTQLAVLRPYRGLNIPLMLMLEAHRRFVAPGQFDYTWLLFDADRAASSLMCKWLGFSAGQHTCASEYGRSRTLVRNERAPGSEQAIWRTEQYVAQRLKTVFSPERVTMQPANSA
jgi:hypothetical protein